MNNTLNLLEAIREVDLDGHVDGRGVRYVGSARKQADGTWTCLADVAGCLCIVEVRLTVPA